MNHEAVRILRKAEVERRTGFSAATIYRKSKAGTFPKPVQLGANSSGWIESEIEAWLAQRVAERDAQAGAA